jgi:hypothetical protein
VIIILLGSTVLYGAGYIGAKVISLKKTGIEIYLAILTRKLVWK